MCRQWLSSFKERGTRPESNLSDSKDDKASEPETHRPQDKIPNASDRDAVDDCIGAATYTDKPSIQSAARSIVKVRRFKRRLETWVPLLNMTAGLLALVAIIVQSYIMRRQTQIMDTQTQIMERSLRVSEETLRASDQSFRISERAYVGVASITAYLQAGEILIMLHNIGHIPAQAITIEGQEIRVTPSANIERTESGERVNENQKGSLFQWEAGEVQLFPGTAMPVVLPMESLGKEEADAISRSEVILYVGGTIHYGDGFGNRDRTTFAFKYNPKPNEHWTAHSDLSKFFNQR